MDKNINTYDIQTTASWLPGSPILRRIRAHRLTSRMIKNIIDLELDAGWDILNAQSRVLIWCNGQLSLAILVRRNLDHVSTTIMRMCRDYAGSYTREWRDLRCLVTLLRLALSS